jgi:hypothetical protein
MELHELTIIYIILIQMQFIARLFMSTAKNSTGSARVGGIQINNSKVHCIHGEAILQV